MFLGFYWDWKRKILKSRAQRKVGAVSMIEDDVKVSEWMKRCICVCVCVCIAGLMSWTVCLPPTALSEPAVIQTDSCISSLSLRHSGTPTTSPRLQQRAKKKKKRWHANNSPGWLGGGTNETSQGIRRRKWESGFEVWTFSFCNVSSWRAHPFSPPSPSTPEKDVHQIRALEPRVKYSKDSIASVSSTTCELCFCSATIPQTTRNGL